MTQMNILPARSTVARACLVLGLLRPRGCVLVVLRSVTTLRAQANFF